jgi:exonuclease SbcD
MKILHTSDWHLGRSLYGRKRYEEFNSFLDWLANLIEEESVDALLVAGDIFDTTTPGNKDQGLYYRFLHKVSESSCRHIVVIGGNHDSSSFLNAPKELLAVLNVHVVGAISGDLEDEVIILTDENNNAEAIVCAIPYLRDRDIRTVEAGESSEDKIRKLAIGLKDHYTAVCAIAEEKKKELGDIPIITMGHLFTAGGKTIDNDGVRELYIGNLAHVEENMFSECIDYLALGHLHVPQQVGTSKYKRYSGSPIPMGFGEAKQQKIVIVVDFKEKTPQIINFKIPVFQELEKIAGDISDIKNRISELKSINSAAWLEIEYKGDDIIGNLREQITEMVLDSEMEIIRVKNARIIERTLTASTVEETLEDLKPDDVFDRCLAAHKVNDTERPSLKELYKEIIQKIGENE